jgi:hypothetical protein
MARYRLDQQVIGVSRDGGRLVVAQVWTGFARGQVRLIVSHNGEIDSEQELPAQQAAVELARVREALAVVVGEAAARTALRVLLDVDVWELQCVRCLEDVPIAARWCTWCGVRRRAEVSEGDAERRARGFPARLPVADIPPVLVGVTRTE